MKKLKREIPHKIRSSLLVLNIIIWLVAVAGFTIRRQQDKRLIVSHHRLIAEFNSYRFYEDYQKRISFLETQMTEEVMLIICPIIPEGFSGTFPRPQVTQLDTEAVYHDGNYQKRLITSFQLSLNDEARFKQKSESTYTKINGDWLMTSYQLLF